MRIEPSTSRVSRAPTSRFLRGWLLGWALAALWLLAAACTSDATNDAGSAADATIVDASAPLPDAGTPDAEATPEDASTPDASAPTGCTCDDREDCAGCIAHLGQCCVNDPGFLGQARLLTLGCQARQACQVCCNECIAKSCEQLIAEKACPAL